MKVGKYQECEEKVMQILKVDNDSVLGFYLLAHLMLQAGKFAEAIIAIEIIVKLKPDNKEFWVLLTMLYRKASNNCGVEFCELKIQGTKFIIGDIEPSPSLIDPEMVTEDDFANILMNQLNLRLFIFVDLTREFMSSTSTNFQNPFEDKLLQVTEMMIKGSIEDAVNLIKTIQIDDENEMNLRLVRGNSLFASGSHWEAICEYEIAYNLHLKRDKKFPQLPAVRCGNWFLHGQTTKNLQKARRYFQHCCKSASTFNAWMGLGIVCYEETNYEEAERYFMKANRIYKRSADNWLYLAITNNQMNRNSLFEKCFHTAKHLKPEDSSLLGAAEKMFDL